MEQLHSNKREISCQFDSFTNIINILVITVHALSNLEINLFIEGINNISVRKILKDAYFGAKFLFI